MNIYSKFAVGFVACAALGYGFASAVAKPDPLDRLFKIEATQKPKTGSMAELPVFPDETKPGRDEQTELPPQGAQFRMKAGKTSLKYLACDQQRTYNGQAELRCVVFSKARGWSKSVRWFPRYQLLPLQGELPAESPATPIRKGV